MTEQSEPPGQQAYPPAEFRRRAVARCIDLLIAASALVLVDRGHPLAGAVLSAALILLGESLFGTGRSLGKRLAGLRVIVLATRRPAGPRESVLRNAIFAAGLLPVVAGAPLQFTFGALVCIALIEAGVALRPLTKDFGKRRIGDLIAGTQVIDASIALGLRAVRPAETHRTASPLASRAARKLHEDTASCALH